MRTLPHELNEIIVAHVAKHDDYIARQDLRSLRLVNKAFSHLATTSLFATVPFWLGLKSLEHLTLISEHPQISQCVTKLIFSPIRFVKWKDPYAYQISVKKRLERDTFSHNTFALAFGKHVAAYKGYLEAQNYLSKNAQDLHILVRALRRLPCMKNVTVVFNDKVIGAQDIMSAFGLLNGNEVTLDAEYTLPILVQALIESERKPEILNLCCEERPSFELFDISRRNLCTKLEPRYKYASEPPDTVTATAFHEAFQGRDRRHRNQVVTLVQRLREFSILHLNFDRDNAPGLYVLSHALEPFAVSAPPLEELTIYPARDGMPTEHDSLIKLESLFRGSWRSHTLRYLLLELVESPAPLLIDLMTQNSHSLIQVSLHYMRITGGGRWSNILTKLRSVSFKTLGFFIVDDSGEVKGTVAAQDYINCITSQSPIEELD